MRHRTLRLAGAIICIVQASGLQVYAGPVVINQVQQVLTANQANPSLRLRNLYDSSAAVASGVTGKPVGQANRTHSPGQNTVDITDTSNPFSVTTSVSQQIGLNIVDQDQVEGTICDCGEILIAGGFPKWPFLFLAAIPLFFISGSEDTPPPTTPVPTPTPTVPPSTPTPPAPVPEPTALLLFGTGLTAGVALLRRRRAKNLLAGNNKTEVS